MSVRGTSCLVILLALALGLSGCGHAQNLVVAAKAPNGMDGVVFTADGAGDFRVSSMMLHKVALEDRLPVHVISFPWSHGYCRVLSDQMHSHHVRAQGKRLADQVEEYHRDFPATPITLWGHSAGAAVIMAALENLPPGIVERALILSPSLSSRYDVRPALASVKEGMYVFYSHHDWVYLGIATCLLGPAEFSATSGRVGFRLLGNGLEDQQLYGKLFQRAWQQGDEHTGNFGGHFGNYQPQFIRRQLVPLLLRR